MFRPTFSYFSSDSLAVLVPTFSCFPSDSSCRVLPTSSCFPFDSFPLALALPFSLIVRQTLCPSRLLCRFFSLTRRQTLWPSPLLLCGFRLHTVRLALLSSLTLLLSLLLPVGLSYLLFPGMPVLKSAAWPSSCPRCSA